MIYEFDIEPIGKPRMTQRDRWMKRKATSTYWTYKDSLRVQAGLLGFAVPESFEITFYLPMPSSWSEKKRKAQEGEPHQQRPDLDNLLKGFLDALCDEDSYVHCVAALKVWSREPRIKVIL